MRGVQALRVGQGRHGLALAEHAALPHDGHVIRPAVGQIDIVGRRRPGSCPEGAAAPQRRAGERRRGGPARRWVRPGSGPRAAWPLILPLPGGLAEPFAGADDQAQAAITAANPDYRPWFTPLWEPPSGEIESLLFALQAALGAGLLGYYLGLRRGQSQPRKPGVDAARRDAHAVDASD